MKAIIFDFDGTLADTLPICFYAFQQVFQQFDARSVTNDDIKAMFGPSETGIIQQNLQHPDVDKAIELYYKAYTEQHAHFVQANTAIAQLLNSLKADYKLGIVTGKARRSLDISLQALQMENLFEVIITGDDVVQPKPHPEGLQQALDLLNVDSSEAVFVGDSDADIQAGKQANVFTIAVQWLEHCDTTHYKLEPDAIVKHVEELMQFVQ
ncbi:HAD family hydrolase [Lysinibacillus piscis]|uniref:Pyrophosphatase PpaX n=1 Tax=Lysinibacillus piscis TaxID=2518931 RepID=A0ABQ5NKA9_9BACI|nr:HAD family hydrolase [Lysinibacillus sp. KH24]GLC88548.1 pyrophosphatase PpaX [Lysinibacillus sp. KH24]